MDRPASIRWQCAALSDTRLSSSDSTPSQFGRKFDFRKGRGLALVQAPTFLCLNNECSRAACRLAALRRRVLLNEAERVFTPPHQTPTRTAQTHACDTASDQSESAQANAQAFGEPRAGCAALSRIGLTIMPSLATVTGWAFRGRGYSSRGETWGHVLTCNLTEKASSSCFSRRSQCQNGATQKAPSASTPTFGVLSQSSQDSSA